MVKDGVFVNHFDYHVDKNHDYQNTQNYETQENGRFSKACSSFQFSELAKYISTERERRNVYFDDDLFGEPIWDILLDIYISSANKRLSSIKCATIGSKAAPTTALRYISILVDRGLVERYASPNDARLTLVRLTKYAMIAMNGYLSHSALPPGLK